MFFLQLLGWTAAMIISGAKAINALGLFGNNKQVFWCVLIAIFIGLWILIGFKNLNRISTIAIGTLFFLL